MEQEVCKEVNNIRYLYKESGCRNWKKFCQLCGVNAVTMSKYNWEGVRPTEDTLMRIAQTFNVSRDYFKQERPQLPMRALRYGYHIEHHTPAKFTLDEIYDAIGMASEDIHLDHDAFEAHLKEIHH